MHNVNDTPLTNHHDLEDFFQKIIISWFGFLVEIITEHFNLFYEVYFRQIFFMQLFMLLNCVGKLAYENSSFSSLCQYMSEIIRDMKKIENFLSTTHFVWEQCSCIYSSKIGSQVFGYIDYSRWATLPYLSPQFC